jgi:hypothetical protein
VCGLPTHTVTNKSTQHNIHTSTIPDKQASLQIAYTKKHIKRKSKENVIPIRTVERAAHFVARRPITNVKFTAIRRENFSNIAINLTSHTQKSCGPTVRIA